MPQMPRESDRSSATGWGGGSVTVAVGRAGSAAVLVGVGVTV